MAESPFFIYLMPLFQSLTRLLRRERTLADLAKWLALPESDLRFWLGSAPPWSRGYDYRRFTIPKRRGGTRTIDAPSDELKALQRRILRRVLNPLPVHPAATGFVRGRSIVENARPHVAHAVVVNIDLADFFPSISRQRVFEMFRARGWSEEAATVLSRICTLEDKLPQGAPTSPVLSNLVCFKLDARLAALAKANGGHYTRYADDMTFSFDGLGKNKRLRPKPNGKPPLPKPAAPVPSRKILATIRLIIEQEGFHIQMKKRVRVQRAHQRQTATGLVVNRAANLPRATRRLIRAMQHHARVGKLDAAGQKRLRGWEALLAMLKKRTP